jgi:predicted neutral ceramidase superfamily lipid hydrolase
MKHKNNHLEDMSTDKNFEAVTSSEEQVHRHPTGRKINKAEEKNRDKTGKIFGNRWFPYHD